MKTKNIKLMFWVFAALVGAMLLEWVVFNRVAAASGKPNFIWPLWIVPLFSVPVPCIAAGIALWRERSHRVRLFSLQWLVALFAAVAAPIVTTEDSIGLAGYLAVNAASVVILTFGCFWSTKRVRMMREEGRQPAQAT